MATLSEALKEAYASAPDDTIYHTLELRHPDFLDESGDVVAIRVVRDFDSLSATLEADAPMNPGETVAFEPLMFDFALPNEVEGNAEPEITITLDNATRLLMPYLDIAVQSGSPVEVTYRPYLASDLTEPHMNPPLNLVFVSFEASVTTVTGRATFGDFANKSFPASLYDDSNWPSLLAQ